MSSNTAMSPENPHLPPLQAEITLGLPLDFADETLRPEAELRIWHKMQSRMQRVSRPILWATAASLAVLILMNVLALNQFSRKPANPDITLPGATYSTGDFTLYDQP